MATTFAQKQDRETTVRAMRLNHASKAVKPRQDEGKRINSHRWVGLCGAD
jgi:hypothetical protein